MKSHFLFLCLCLSFASSAQTAWQQKVNTKIDVTLNDGLNRLSAYEEFNYTNNSPDTLHYIFIHLWANAYKNDHTPFAKQLDLQGNTSFYYSKPKDKGRIDSLQFTVDGQSVEYYSTEDAPDIARIDLPKPLYPGQSMTVATPFRVVVPKVFSRMGHTGQAYFISQWFPKPAVYDRKGWHPISYLDQGEFFSEYGSYDVSITLPANYIVMATGNCLDETEMSWLDELSKKPLPSDTLYTHGSLVSDVKMKTLHFHEDRIHDFAWFADKRWIVRKDTVRSPGTGELVTAWTAFLPVHQKQWIKACDYLKETIKHYGKWVGPYTYKTVKAVEGDMHAGGGMEYPTVTVIDRTSVSSLKSVVIHEAGHNWFYGMLGSNERDHAWMDEGINTFYEQKTTSELADTGKRKGTTIGIDETLFYYEEARTRTDQAIDQTAANFTRINYGIDVYYKTALMLRWLEEYMGEEDFERCMHDYYDTWHHNHPYPEDFRTCMQRHSKKNTDWFFDIILHTDKKIDFVITDAHTNGTNTEITVRNNSDVLSPVLINAYKGDSLTASVWSAPFTGTTTVSIPAAEWSTLRVDKIIPDAKSTNNVYRRNALFHHYGVKVKPVLGLNVSDKDKLFISPAIGVNQYDGFMAGLLFHNLTLPENRFRFAIAPLYSFRTNSFAGTGSVGYVWYPENIFKEVLLQGEAKTFYDDKTSENLSSPLYARYMKVAPSLLFTFNEHNPLSSVTRTLLLKEYNISEQTINYGDSLGKPLLTTQQKTYGLIRYKHKNSRTYNPFDYSFEAQGGADFTKISAEGNIRIDYNVKHKSLYVRAYVGKFFAINSDPAVTSRYELNASYTGLDDYLYDGTFIGRNASGGLGAQQVSIQEGGFKVPTYNNADRSDNWMATINLKTDLPLGKLPIRLFFDAGLIPNSFPTMTNSGSTTLLYDGGVELHLIKDIVSIYVPVIMSSDFQNYLQNTYGRRHQFTRSLSFTFDLQNINWLKAPGSAVKLATN
jgi:hypothetical protein